MKKKLIIAAAALLLLVGGGVGAVVAGLVPVDAMLAAVGLGKSEPAEVLAEGEATDEAPAGGEADATSDGEGGETDAAATETDEDVGEKEEVVPGPEVVWRLSYWGAPRVDSAGIEHLADYVMERTEGRFRIQIGWDSEFSKPDKNLDGIRDGKFEAAVVCSHFYTEAVPTLSLVSLPFLPFDDLDVFQYVIEKVYALPSMRKEMANWNALPYLSSLYPQHQAIGRGPAPDTLEAWTGKRVSAPAQLGEAMRSIGAKSKRPSTSPGSLLKRKKVDAYLAPFSPGPLDEQLLSSATWYTTNMSAGTNDCPLVLAKDAYSKLPLEYKLLLKKAKLRAYDALKHAYRDEHNSNWARMRGSMTAITYSGDDMYSFKVFASKPVWIRWVKRWQKQFPASEYLEYVLKLAKDGAALKVDGKLG